MADLTSPTVQALLDYAKAFRKNIKRGESLPYWLRGRGKLSGVDLVDANLSGIDLESTDLSGAKLTGAKLNNTDLKRAKLVHTILRGADLEGADLSEAQLHGADLVNANLSRAKLINCFSASRATLIGARFTKGIVIAAGEGNRKLILWSEDKIRITSLEDIKDTNHHG